MGLNLSYNLASSIDATPPPPFSPIQNQTWIIPYRDCIGNFPPDDPNHDRYEDVITGKRIFNGGIAIEFAPGKLDEFLKENAFQKYNDITRIIEERMESVMPFEHSRDNYERELLGGDVSAEEEDLIRRGISEGTWGDLDIVIEQELTGILQMAYPDSGIMKAYVDSLEGDPVNGCMLPAERLQDHAQDTFFPATIRQTSSLSAPRR